MADLRIAENRFGFTLQQEPEVFENSEGNESIRLVIPLGLGDGLGAEHCVCFISSQKRGFKKLKKKLTSGAIVQITRIEVGEAHMVWNPDTEEHEPSEPHMDEKGLPRFKFEGYTKSKSDVWIHKFQDEERASLGGFKFNLPKGVSAPELAPAVDDVQGEDVIDATPASPEVEDKVEPIIEPKDSKSKKETAKVTA